MTGGGPPCPCAPGWVILCRGPRAGPVAPSPLCLLPLHVRQANCVNVGCRQADKWGDDQGSRYPVHVATQRCCCHVPPVAHWRLLEHGGHRISCPWGCTNGPGLLQCPVTRGAPPPPCAPAGCLLCCWLKLSPPCLLSLHVRHHVAASVVRRQVDKWGGGWRTGCRYPVTVASLSSCPGWGSTGKVGLGSTRFPI